MKTIIYQVLDHLGIDYQRVHHPPVFTVEEARRLVPQLSAQAPKNLFLRDKKGKNHILLVVEEHKSIRFEEVEQLTGLKRLSLASPERLMRMLGVTPGAVSLLALINDPDGLVQVLIDRDLWQEERIQAHPLVNTETLVLSVEDMERFIVHTGHTIQFLDIK